LALLKDILNVNIFSPGPALHCCVNKERERDSRTAAPQQQKNNTGKTSGKRNQATGLSDNHVKVRSRNVPIEECVPCLNSDHGNVSILLVGLPVGTPLVLESGDPDAVNTNHWAAKQIEKNQEMQKRMWGGPAKNERAMQKRQVVHIRAILG
jgi:hypothetical protein